MLDLVIPERCLHCDEPAAHALGSPIVHTLLPKYLCGICIRLLLSDEEPGRAAFSHMQDSTKAVLDKANARFHFVDASPIQSLIHHFKYRSMPRLAFECGCLISESIEDQTFDYIIPVPLHRTRLAERGFNQAEEIAKGIARHSGGAVLHATSRIRPTPTQTSLSFAERLENVRGAFRSTRLAPVIRGKRIAIVDDVMTTGATIASVAEALVVYAPASIGAVVLCVAATDRG